MWQDTRSKIVSASKAAEAVSQAVSQGKKVVFTNGCFDILHAGHVRYLGEARNLGDLLILGLNSDNSVKRQNKAPDRPINNQENRAEVISALAAVDYVIIFDEDTPARLIELIRPGVLVKGGDWPVHKIVGADTVKAAGGEVHSIPLVTGLSTTNVLARIRESQEE
ncbi:D-glycero-beta-D-manno-heptose 1-phosphate adenylyltransferase [Dethiosulfatarculus sandiegensis]|uniref:D-glycero-beta-D-manno-heptose 1-phosphate adenylyltransferase n=1 Tax=Dethiosulfatarculus sandiegensis TaxID=1429043 RepID=A0A0D2GKS4_9BACT|nr:D-glycero-beta-D-manno-heptose 1-phosphate adenylyltransferase [Dethiosulfatarculus sandiegensis]KIX15347.1 nucleotidyltransferase [Dethiosulfatarculus sandiegensis]